MAKRLNTEVSSVEGFGPDTIAKPLLPSLPALESQFLDETGKGELRLAVLRGNGFVLSHIAATPLSALESKLDSTPTLFLILQPWFVMEEKSKTPPSSK